LLEQKLINITPNEDDNNDIPVKRVTDVRAEEIEKEYLKRMHKFDTEYSDDNQCVQWLRGLHGKNVTPVVTGRIGECTGGIEKLGFGSSEYLARIVPPYISYNYFKT